MIRCCRHGRPSTNPKRNDGDNRQEYLPHSVLTVSLNARSATRYLMLCNRPKRRSPAMTLPARRSRPNKYSRFFKNGKCVSAKRSSDSKLCDFLYTRDATSEKRLQERDSIVIARARRQSGAGRRNSGRRSVSGDVRGRAIAHSEAVRYMTRNDNWQPPNGKQTPRQ